MTWAWSWGHFIAGDRAKLRYARARRAWIGLHGFKGVILIASGARAGRRNHLVELDDGRRVVVPGMNMARKVRGPL